MKRSKCSAAFAALLALLLGLSAFAVFPNHVNAETKLAQPLTVPEGYNEHDYNKLVAFLETEDENGIRNGEKLSEDYDPFNPQTWGEAIEWTETDDGLRVTAIECSNMQLEGSLDLDGCAELSQLFCGVNRITELTVTQCPNLEYLGCGCNRFTTLDVSQNINLFYLDCIAETWDGSGVIQTVFLPHTNTLEIFSCYNNRISEIDISCLTGLRHFECALNPLERLDISNNKSLEGLSCTDCYIRELIADNPNLRTLNCENNRIQNLVLRGMDSLETLECFDNELEMLDLSECPKLTRLSCCNNRLTELDMTHNPMLESLYCWGNSLSSIDLSKNSLISELKTTYMVYDYQELDNALTELDLTNCNLIIDHVQSEGGGNIAANSSDEYGVLYARQWYGWFFDGWYNEEDELVSMMRDINTSMMEGTVFTAKFIPDGVHVFYGDIDGNGQIAVPDAVLVLRFAMGLIELDSIQRVLADVDADGEIGVCDAITILRMAMGTDATV